MSKTNGHTVMVPQCRFRDCTKPVLSPYAFCEFHCGAEAVDERHALGSMRAVERALKQQPDHSDSKRYGMALADVLTKWFGDEGKLVAAEALRVLETMR